MKAYRLTDADSIRHALEKARGVPGRSDKGDSSIVSIADEKVNDAVVLEFDRPPGDTLTIAFKENLLRIRLNRLDERSFAVKDVAIESAQRSAERMAADQMRALNVSIAPAVDIASSVAMYGRTSGIARVCQLMKMHLEEHLNARGFLISDCEVGFFYNTDDALLVAMEAAVKSFFVMDTLSRKLAEGPEFTDYFSEMSEGKRDGFFTQLARDRVRSEFVYPFRDQGGNAMGYMRLRSTMPGLGNGALAQGAARDLKVFTNYLLERAESLVFEMEMTAIKSWSKVSDSEEIIDLSQNGRGIRITLPAGIEKVIRKGGKVQFFLQPGTPVPHAFIGTIRSISTNPTGVSAGIRIHRGAAPESMDTLARFARALKPAIGA